MDVSLTPELEARVRARIDRGLYNNASEDIREALRFMDTHEDWIHDLKIAKLREQIQVGIDQMNQSTGKAIESRADLQIMFDQFKN